MSETIKSLFSIPMFCEIVTSAISLSLCSFELLKVEQYLSVKFAARLQFAVSTFIELFIFSRASENLRMESAKIADKIYECRWYSLKSKKQIRLLMTVSTERAKQPVQLSALGFFNISFETFVSVSKIKIVICRKN